MIISLDTETTGVDFAHGAMPFLVTTCDEEGRIRYWEWDVNPRYRKPIIPRDDPAEIAELIDAADLIYLQNAKFDARALHTIGIELPWHKVRDTLVMGHLLASNHPHDLTSMCINYLGVDIEPFEKEAEEIVKACRDLARRHNPDWLIARESTPNMPSLKGGSGGDIDKPWKNDMWLPRAIARNHDDYDLRCETVTADYANADSSYTLPLGLEMERIIQENGWWAIYEHRLELPRIAYEMELYGVTGIGSYTDETIRDYEMYVAEANCELRCIADGYGHELELADGASLNDNMREFFYGSIRQRCPKCKYQKCVKHWNGEQESETPCPKCSKRKRNPQYHQLITTRAKNLALPVIGGKKTGNASLDKNAMMEYQTTLDEGPALDFIKLLSNKRKHDTDLSYMNAYRRFGLSLKDSVGDFYRIHPSLNPFGTHHLRWSSNNPNLQNVGKQEDECEECEGRDKGCLWCGGTGKTRTSIRRCFGPAPGREWWSMDFQNIELRIPAYESGEMKMIDVFEKPNDPPFWGSYHNLIASIVHPDEYFAGELHLTKDGFKKKYKSTLYQWIKNFNFAKQYGCGKRKGDATARKKGAFDLVDTGLPLLTRLQMKYLQNAEVNGYVATLPDRTIDGTQGYPILVGRNETGGVLTTTPFNYHVSGTACWCKNTALIRCNAQLRKWREEEGFDGHIALEIHDEILFDFPRGNGPETNYERAMVLKGLMEQSGEDLIPRIPTPVSVEYHPLTWAEGIAC